MERQEGKPFGLIRTITSTATKIGLRSIQFEMLDLGDEGQEAVAGIRELPFKMKFEATFPQLLNFLQELEGLTRIVTVRNLEIQRKPKNVPYQSVAATLSTYSFPD